MVGAARPVPQGPGHLTVTGALGSYVSCGVARVVMDQIRSNRSASMTVVQAATKSCTNFSRASSLA